MNETTNENSVNESQSKKVTLWESLTCREGLCVLLVIALLINACLAVSIYTMQKDPGMPGWVDAIEKLDYRSGRITIYCTDGDAASTFTFEKQHTYYNGYGPVTYYNHYDCTDTGDYLMIKCWTNTIEYDNNIPDTCSCMYFRWDEIYRVDL